MQVLTSQNPSDLILERTSVRRCFRNHKTRPAVGRASSDRPEGEPNMPMRLGPSFMMSAMLPGLDHGPHGRNVVLVPLAVQIRPSGKRRPVLWASRRPLGNWPQVGARGDQSRDVPSHHVGGKRAEAAPPEAPRRDLHLHIPPYLDGSGARVAPPLASSLHSSFHCRWCLLALYCGRLGASEAGEDVVLPGPHRAAPRRGEAILTMVAT